VLETSNVVELLVVKMFEQRTVQDEFEAAVVIARGAVADEVFV